MPRHHSKRQTTRTFGPGTFTKAMKERPLQNIHDVDTGKKWPFQCIWNEANAFEHIRGNITILVPRVIETGECEDGMYFMVESLDGIQLDKIGKRCRQQTAEGNILYGHQGKDCGACQTIANDNAAIFIIETMLP